MFIINTRIYYYFKKVQQLQQTLCAKIFYTKWHQILCNYTLGRDGSDGKLLYLI